MAEWLAIAGAVTGIVGAVTGTVGGVVAGIEQHNAQKRQAEIAEQNAKIQQQQAAYNERLEQREAAAVEAETRENARRQREASERLKASQRAAFGKSGALMTAGSPLAVLGETAADEELKVQDLQYQGYRQQQKHLIAATGYNAERTIAGINAANAKKSAPSVGSFAGSLAGSIGSGAMQIGNSLIAYNKIAGGK